MKAKNNLDLFRNEIIDELTKGGYIYDVMMNIYLRESGNETRCVDHMLKWYADVPRETLYLDKWTYNFLKTYYKLILEDVANSVNNIPIEWCTPLEAFMELFIIPRKYASMPLNEFMDIIRLKTEDNK